ncbi:MAG: hypothetical protein ACRCSC_04150 [Lactococcus garvieae]
MNNIKKKISIPIKSIISPPLVPEFFRQKFLAEELLHFIDSSNIPEIDLFERVNFMYQKAHFEVVFGDRRSIETMKKCQSIFEQCASYQMAQKLAEEIKSLEALFKPNKQDKQLL